MSQMSSCQIKLSPSDFSLDIPHLAQGRITMPKAQFQSDSIPQGFLQIEAFTAHCTPTQLRVSPDSSTKIRAFPHLVVRHDIERVPVQGEGHVPEDGAAAVLHHSQCLIQHSSFQSSVHPDLWRQPQGQRDIYVMPLGPRSVCLHVKRRLSFTLSLIAESQQYVYFYHNTILSFFPPQGSTSVFIFNIQ